MRYICLSKHTSYITGAVAASFITQELRDFHPDRQHDESEFRNLDEEKGINNSEGQNIKMRYQQILSVLNKTNAKLMLPSNKGSGKSDAKGKKAKVTMRFC